jgi:uncharacterized membrane protein YfcA
MTNRTARIAIVAVSAAAMGGFLAPYLRKTIEKNLLDYLNGIFSLMVGIFLLLVGYRNGKRTEAGRQQPKIISICGIAAVICGVVMLLMKLLD